jgi:O-antigen/teichoic acid export membrane protein
MMYHTSRDHDAHDDKIAVCLTLAGIISTLIGWLFFLASSQIADLMNQNLAAPWFRDMAWIIPAFTMNSVLTSWYRAKQNIETMVVFFEIIPMLTRLIGLTVLLLTTFSTGTIAYIFVASYALPFLILYLKKPMQPSVNIKNLELWDITYGAQSMLAQLVNKSIRNIVIFALGFFVTAGAIADFTLAMRLGQFLQMPKLAIAQLQIPRMGQFLKTKDNISLLQEFDIMRNVSLALTLFGTAAFIIASPIIFMMFPDYQNAFPVFMILASASIIRAGFGAIGGYLNIAGYAGYGLITNAATLAILMILLITLIPLLGIMGASIALTIAALLSMLSMAIVIKVKEQANTFKAPSILAMLISVITLALYSLFYAPEYIVALVLIACAFITVIPVFKSMKEVMKNET